MIVHKLNILHSNGQSSGVNGSYEVLRAAVDEWKNWIVAGEPTADRIIEIVGMYNDARRTEHRLFVDLQGVDGMCILEL